MDLYAGEYPESCSSRRATSQATPLRFLPDSYPVHLVCLGLLTRVAEDVPLLQNGTGGNHQLLISTERPTR